VSTPARASSSVSARGTRPPSGPARDRVWRHRTYLRDHASRQPDRRLAGRGDPSGGLEEPERTGAVSVPDDVDGARHRGARDLRLGTASASRPGGPVNRAGNRRTRDREWHHSQALVPMKAPSAVADRLLRRGRCGHGREATSTSTRNGSVTSPPGCSVRTASRISSQNSLTRSPSRAGVENE
jgi:hypothetical protein